MYAQTHDMRTINLDAKAPGDAARELLRLDGEVLDSADLFGRAQSAQAYAALEVARQQEAANLLALFNIPAEERQAIIGRQGGLRLIQSRVRDLLGLTE